jgi:hypothetical protein
MGSYLPSPQSGWFDIPHSPISLGSAQEFLQKKQVPSIYSPVTAGLDWNGDVML